MKTRVIQDDPERAEPARARTTSPPAQMQRAKNVAARMGALERRHWKTAVFGWLAFVVVAVFVRCGRHQVDRRQRSERRRVAHAPTRSSTSGFPQRRSADRDRARPDATQTVERPGLPAAVQDVDRARSTRSRR